MAWLAMIVDEDYEVTIVRDVLGRRDLWPTEEQAQAAIDRWYHMKAGDYVEEMMMDGQRTKWSDATNAIADQYPYPSTREVAI